MAIGKREVLNLYKQLIRYSNTLRFTDKTFYLQKVRKEFEKNRTLVDASEVDFYYQVYLPVLRYHRF
ncbi:uncharacterized protein B4U79_07380 [Dinothrombium tinctorium]|uniref:Complex 1 LYR protein domain-containing protein n=1 Tax=Dinothrombium tinctorium TaxID=1965070 RepID=A0A3S3P3X3_9ACAR|nr:uncharacterized protein B4U79_07380 [Dinothrombium tinctorium]